MAEWAEQDRFINQPGAYTGPWKNETVPYLVEPMEVLTSFEFRACIYAGSAQSGKTDALLINWIGYGATSDPGDMLVICPTHMAARDFSIRRVDRLHRHTESVGEALLKSKDSDNRTDKQYSNGMMLSLGHPSATELAGRPVGRVGFTDYDRMDDDIDGEGSAFDLGSKRTTTFQSFAMSLAESSPSKPVLDHKKILSGHEAPPCQGILGLYNRGDRRRWYWPCPSCGSYFEGRWEHLVWQHDEGWSNLDCAETVHLECPACLHKIHPDYRHAMQQMGIWLKEGQSVQLVGGYPMIVGVGRRSNIASFWQNGVGAGLTTWVQLVKSYLDAKGEFDDTGEEGSLQKFFNTDVGVPYIPQAVANAATRLPEHLSARCEDLPNREVPEPVRLLIATVDVQQNMFVVQIQGIAPGRPFDIYLIDRYQIRKSKRLDKDGERLWVKPSSYPEDWDLLVDQVFDKTYPLADGSGRKMSVKMTFCDSGGKAGVTSNAYDFYRKTKATRHFGRFYLVKGASRVDAPRAEITYPDSNRSGTKAGAVGDVPVLRLNPTILKDNLDGRLDVIVPGSGMIHLPSWLNEGQGDEDMSWFFAEMTSEKRDASKGWLKIAKQNEAWDLFYYTLGGCMSSLLNLEKLDWSNAPSWAGPWDKNPLVIAPEDHKPFQAAEASSGFDFADLGRSLAGE